VVTTDTFVEGRHYLPDWCPPSLAGRRLAIAHLSDIAAMGARPRWAVRSSGVHASSDVDSLVEFERALARTLEADGAHLVGGNLTAVEGARWFSLTLLGDVGRDRAWRRAGARAGDPIAITGRPGRSSAGYRLVRKLGEGARDARWNELLGAWIEPACRVGFAQALARERCVTAAIDLSDGFAADLRHVCEASGAGAAIDMAAWPADDLLNDASAELGLRANELRLGPGDDYELVLVLDPDAVDTARALAAEADVPLSIIGRVTTEPGRIVVRDEGKEHAIDPAGFDHFGRASQR
jgi:thiamine-monophosphate kinase